MILYWLTPSMSIKSQLLQYIDGLVQEKRTSSALAMELCLSCINPSMSFKVTGQIGL